LGLSLIERVIVNAKKSGVNDFTIVIGYEGDEIKKELGDGSDYGVKITYVENTEWERGNGVSVLKAKGTISENNHDKFFLLMADHVFEQRILEDMKKMNLEKDSCVLVVDESPKRHIDLVDATKVRIENGYIVEIGKKLENYNGVDCGIFLYNGVDCGIFLLAPSAIFEALEESGKNNDDTLSGGIKILGKNKQIKTFSANGHFWIDVDTENDYLEAEKLLLNNNKNNNNSHINR
jgi:choline kinase